jgi:cell division protein FtsB
MDKIIKDKSSKAMLNVDLSTLEQRRAYKKAYRKQQEENRSLEQRVIDLETRLNMLESRFNNAPQN